MPRWFAAVLLAAGLGAGCGGEEAPQTPVANRAPTLSAPTASQAEVFSGTEVQLAVTASDADGDALSYLWSQVPAEPVGGLERSSGPETRWTAPVVEQPTRFTLQVSVSDGRGGSAQGEVQVQVAPLHRPPL